MERILQHICRVLAILEMMAAVTLMTIMAAITGILIYDDALTTKNALTIVLINAYAVFFFVWGWRGMCKPIAG